MVQTKKSASDEIVDILEVPRGTFTIGIVGTTPLIVHRFSDKARRELLMPAAKKNQAERAQSLKHEPYKEAQGAATVISDDSAPTFLGIPAVAFKCAMATTALNIPGITKTSIGRLLSVDAEYSGGVVPVWGDPFIHAAMVRNSDMARTPDVRFRTIFPRWAAVIRINYSANLKPKSVMNLLAASGFMAGVGDGRIEKGKFDFGCYSICDPEDADFLKRLRPNERALQAEAYANLPSYDAETSELLEWYDAELKRREMVTAIPAAKKRAA